MSNEKLCRFLVKENGKLKGKEMPVEITDLAKIAGDILESSSGPSEAIPRFLELNSMLCSIIRGLSPDNMMQINKVLGAIANREDVTEIYTAPTETGTQLH